MKVLLRAVSGLALVGTIAPPLLFVANVLDLDQLKAWMAVATVAWFAATPLWMDRPGR
jgi:hypothetical protein